MRTPNLLSVKKVRLKLIDMSHSQYLTLPAIPNPIFSAIERLFHDLLIKYTCHDCAICRFLNVSEASNRIKFS